MNIKLASNKGIVFTTLASNKGSILTIKFLQKLKIFITTLKTQNLSLPNPFTLTPKNPYLSILNSKYLKMLVQRLFSSARRKLLVTGVGSDHKLIARDISSLIFNEEGQITESRITKFQQTFTLTFLVEILEKNLESFKESLNKSRDKLSIHLQASELNPEPVQPTFKKAVLTVTSEQDPNTLKTLLSFLTKQGVTVNKSETASFQAPMCGTELFTSLFSINLNQDFSNFQEKLRELDDSLIVSVELRQDSEMF